MSHSRTSTPPAAGSGDPLDFVPVPSASTRHDGWTPIRQRDFIDRLASIGVVSAAAKAVGMSPKSAYALRRRAGERFGFAAAWDRAVREGRSRALDTAIERALHGEEAPVFYRGRQVGTRIRYNDRLLMAALQAIDPGARASICNDDLPWRK